MKLQFTIPNIRRDRNGLPDVRITIEADSPTCQPPSSDVELLFLQRLGDAINEEVKTLLDSFATADVQQGTE